MNQRISYLIISLILLLTKFEVEAQNGFDVKYNSLQDTRTILDFVMHKIRFDTFCFYTSKFPSCDFDEPDKVRSLIGPYTITSTFYDGEAKPVISAGKPGRYAAVVEIRRLEGVTSKRFVTLFRLADKPSNETWGRLTDNGKVVNIQHELINAAGIDKDLYDKYAGEFELLTQSRMPPAPGQKYVSTQKEATAAVMLAALYDLTALKASGKPLPDDSLMELERQWWVDFKRHHYGYDKLYPKAFICPSVIEGKPARILREGTLIEAGMKIDAIKKIDAACNAWVNEEGIGFGLCVVRHGIVVLNKGYGIQASGPDKDKPFTASTRAPLASATKFLSAILLLEFVDQGLIGIDEPYVTYVPALRDRPPMIPGRQMTIRDGYLHIGGFPGTQWGYMMNDLEEIVADLYPKLPVGQQFEYEGTSLALGGKIMEMISGESLPRLYRKHLFGPLDCNDSEGGGTAAGNISTALDLARIGQMMLNEGTYGNMRFFHPATLKSIMPIPGRERFDYYNSYPIRWGVGIKQFDIDGLSNEAYGHPGATGSCLVIDPASDLVIAMTRFRESKDGELFADFLKKKSIMYKAILSSIKK